MLVGGLALAAFAASGASQQPVSVYPLTAQLTNAQGYYLDVSGLPESGRLGLRAGSWGMMSTDSGGKIYGATEVLVPSVGGRFACDVSGSISRPAISTRLWLTLKGTGLALDASSNQVPASLALTFQASPLFVARQSMGTITVTNNVAVLFNDGTLDGQGNPLWQTNLQLVYPTVTNIIPAQTNYISYYTLTNQLTDAGPVTVGFNFTNLASVVPESTRVVPGVSSYSFTNDWTLFQGRLSGSLRVSGRTTPLNDPLALLVQAHVTNWQGAPLIIQDSNGSNVYSTVYRVLVDGNLNLNVVDSLAAQVMRLGSSLRFGATNFTGIGTVSSNRAHHLSLARGTLFEVAPARGSFLTLTATNGDLITSYDVDSNAAPVVVTITNSIGVPPVFSLTNTVSGILQLDDVVNYVTTYVTNADSSVTALVIESHYGAVDLTNPAYITNVVHGAIKSLSVGGKLEGQLLPPGSGYNLDAQYQLLPLGVAPPVVYP